MYVKYTNIITDSFHVTFLREGVKKEIIVADMSVKGGGVNPLSATIFFFLKREKNAECSETLTYVFERISNYLDFFSQNHTESIDMHIEILY